MGKIPVIISSSLELVFGVELGQVYSQFQYCDRAYLRPYFGSPAIIQS